MSVLYNFSLPTTNERASMCRSDQCTKGLGHVFWWFSLWYLLSPKYWGLLGSFGHWLTYSNFSQMTIVRIVHQVCLKFPSFNDFRQIFLAITQGHFKRRLWEMFLCKMPDHLYSFESHIQCGDFEICCVKLVQFAVVCTRWKSLSREPSEENIWAKTTFLVPKYFSALRISKCREMQYWCLEIGIFWNKTFQNEI